MPLGTDYAHQDCSIARALEVVGDRWTLLIVRDAFFGVRRFGDFMAHLDISKATLTERLTRLTREGVLARVPRGKREDYVLTPAGEALWPALFALAQWGEQEFGAAGPRRIFAHATCGTDLQSDGVCTRCGLLPAASELDMRPGPGATLERSDQVSLALGSRRRILQPLVSV